MSHCLYSLKKLDRTVPLLDARLTLHFFSLPPFCSTDGGNRSVILSSEPQSRNKTQTQVQDKECVCCMTADGWVRVYLQDHTPPSAGLLVTQCITRGSAVFILSDKVLPLDSLRRCFAAFLIFWENYCWRWRARYVVTWLHCTKEADIFVCMGRRWQHEKKLLWMIACLIRRNIQKILFFSVCKAAGKENGKLP